MQDTQSQLITIKLSTELAAAVGSLRSATGRDDHDIVTSALRTYLADQRQRDAVAAHFYVIPTGYPSAYVVTARASLRGQDSGFGPDARQRAEATFGQINRYTPTRLSWSSDGRSVVVDLGVSGQAKGEASATAAKMVRNRLVDELGVTSLDNLDVEILATYDLHCG